MGRSTAARCLLLAACVGQCAKGLLSARPALTARGVALRATRMSLAEPLRKEIVTEPAVVSSVGRPKSPFADPPAHTGILTPCELYANVVAMGQRKAKLVTNEPKKTLILGVLAGAYISVGALLALTIGANCPGLVGSNQGLQRLIYGAIGLPFGLFFTLVCGGELFTGNTAAMMAAVLEKRATVKQLAKNWVVSFSANLVASLAMAWLVFHSGVVFNPAAAVGMAVYKTKLSFGAAFIRGMLCNWLVCMAVWMASGCTSATDKFVSIWLPITAFTAIGFEHSVANMFLIPLGIMHGAPVSMATFFIKNLLPVTLGNILGGALGISGAYSMVYGDLDKEAESRYI